MLVVGHVCIDTNQSEHAAYCARGSPAVFMEQTWKQLPNINVSIIAPYGADLLAFPRHLSLYPSNPLGIHTLVYENIVTEGVRTQKCLYVQESTPIPIDTHVISMITSADIVCLAPLTPYFPATYVSELKRHIKKNAIMALLPQGYFREITTDGTVHVREFEEAPEILPVMDIVIVSDQDHPDMLSLGTYWSDLYKSIVVVTQAERGATVIENGIPTSIPTEAVPLDSIISSVGAGDVFGAAFLYKYIISHNAVDSAKFGNFTARQHILQQPN